MIFPFLFMLCLLLYPIEQKPICFEQVILYSSCRKKKQSFWHLFVDECVQSLFLLYSPPSVFMSLFSLIVDLLCFYVCFVLNKPVQSPSVSYSFTSVFMCLISLFVNLLCFLNKYFWSHMFSQHLPTNLLRLSL